jgi:Ca2+-transporting ATPase
MSHNFSCDSNQAKSMDGLTTTEAARRLSTHGPNLLPGKIGESLLKIFARQFKSPVI